MKTTSAQKRATVFRKMLAEARKSVGLTQAQLAVRLRPPQSYVSKYESGERRLDVLEFSDIAEELGIDIASFLKTLRARYSHPAR
jgi:transcriptional regulator with XRE-family HTH domain